MRAFSRYGIIFRKAYWLYWLGGFITGSLLYFSADHFLFGQPGGLQSPANTSETGLLPSTQVPEGNDVSATWFLGGTILFLSVAVVFLVVSVVYLFKWRKHVSPKQKSLVPSELLKGMKEQETNLSNLAKASKDVHSRLNLIFDHFNNVLNELLEAIQAMQKVIDEKDREINDLKSGYELRIFEKFLRRFIKVHTEMEHEINDLKERGTTPPESLKHIYNLLTDALEECEVGIYSPKIGSDYKKVFGVDEHFKKVGTQNPKDDFKIVEVLSPGYIVNTPNGKKTIKPARVAVTIYEKARG